MSAISEPASSTLQALRQLEDDPVLEAEDVGERAVDLDVAQDDAGRHLDEAGGDADLGAEPLVAAGDDPARAEAAADLDREPVVERLGLARLQVAQRVEDALAADHGQAVDALQVRADGLGDARSDPLVGRLARDVREGDDGDRAVLRLGRRRAGPIGGSRSCGGVPPPRARSGRCAGRCRSRAPTGSGTAAFFSSAFRSIASTSGVSA